MSRLGWIFRQLVGWFFEFAIGGWFGFFGQAGQIWGKWFSQVPWEQGRFGNFITCVVGLVVGCFSATAPDPFPYIILAVFVLIMAKMWESKTASTWFDVRVSLRLGFLFHSAVNSLVLTIIILKFLQ